MSENPNEQGLMADVNPDAVPPYDPEEEDVLSITTDEIDMIERLVFAEAGTEGEEGRDAVRGVIFNRLSSDRFPNSVQEVIEQRGQFEPIGKHGNVFNIPVPEDKLESQKYEMDAYLNTGVDASGGRTFFLNKDIAKRRGTDFSGDKPLTIGKHTFYSGFPGQEPVRVSPTSHNITVVDSRPGTIEQLMSGDMAPVITEDAVAPASDQEALVADTGSQFASLAPTNETASTPSPRLSTATDDVLSNFTTRDRSDVGSQTRSMFNLDAPGTMEDYDADTGRVNTGILQSIREALGFAEGGMAVSGNQDIEPPQGDGSVLLPYEPTLQEKAKYAISGFLQDKFGMGNYEANDLSEKFTGNPNATDGSYGIGLADFTPAGLVFGADNAKDSFQRARNSDDRLGMGLAVVEGGLAAAEAFPLTKLAARGAKQGIETLADIAQRIEYDPTVMGMNGGNFKLKDVDADALSEVSATPEAETTLIEEALNSVVPGEAPKSTITGYRIYDTVPGTGVRSKTQGDGSSVVGRPLFVNKNDHFQEGQWYEAKFGEIDPKTGKVKSSLQGGVAPRPGFHSGEAPTSSHLGGKATKGAKKVNYRKATEVWARVDIPNDVPWQEEANRRATTLADGVTVDASTAEITDQIPVGGNYRYKTNPNMDGSWIISGSVKVDKFLSPEEAAQVAREMGVEDLPRLPELIDRDNLAFEDLTNSAQAELKRYYPDKYNELVNGVPAQSATPDAGPAQAVLDIRAAQMELATKDRIQPSGKDPLFNLTPEGYENTLPEQSEVYVPRQPQGTEQPLPKNNRAAFVNDNIEAISDRLAERMKPWLGTEAQYFYHTGPIVDKALDMGFSKEEIYSWLKDFSDAYAATSPRTKTADNLRNATLVMTKKHLGIPYDEIIGPNKGQRNEKGYAMIINRKGDISSSGKVANADGLHRKLLDTLDADGIDPNTNPKPYTFAQNVYGNLDGVTVDTHAVRGALSAVNEIDPGSIPIDYIKPKFRKQYTEDPTSLDPATMIDDSIGSQMIDGTDMQTEYAVFSDVYRRTAEKLGVSPAEAQSLGWFGSGDSTGLASELKSVASLIEDRIDVTAQGLGKPKEEVFKMLLNREIPVLQIFGTAGAGAAALGSMDEQMQQFSKGGLTQGESEKGIRTQEGKDMADKVFKLDFSKADINDDGKLSEYEKARGEAIQKATNEEDGIMMAAHGGMPCGCGGDCDGSCGDDGSMPGMIVGTDPVSGNEIPLGSEAENVRDDIPAMLSEGEYVLPADVVKWHGLKHISSMMMEAKAGLMSLQAMGQIHEVEEVFYDEEEEYSDDMVECPECGGEGCEHCDGMGYHSEAEESYETPEGNEVDIAEVITEEETPEYDEEENTVETISYAMKSTPKIAFIR